MIDKSTAWQSIKLNAKKAMLTNMEYTSLIEEKQYKITDVQSDAITIYRLKEGTLKKLTRKKVEEAIHKLNQNGGKIKRRTLISPTVAEETTFVLFHPQLNDTKEFIIEINT
jgi:F0F1-type ATP synthase alpha subunit